MKRELVPKIRKSSRILQRIKQPVIGQPLFKPVKNVIQVIFYYHHN